MADAPECHPKFLPAPVRAIRPQSDTETSARHVRRTRAPLLHSSPSRQHAPQSFHCGTVQARYMSTRVSEPRGQLDDRDAVQMNRTNDLPFQGRESGQNLFNGPPIEHVFNAVWGDSPLGVPQDFERNDATTRAIRAYFTHLGRGCTDKLRDVTLPWLTPKQPPKLPLRRRPSSLEVAHAARCS